MTKAFHLWRIQGSFFPPEADAEETENGFRYVTEAYRIETTRETDKNGVCLQKTCFTNTSDHPLTIGCALSRLRQPDGEYDVYTQTNVHYSESSGKWQELHTAVTARSPYCRTAFGIAPMIALWNRQTHRGMAVHLLAEGAWEITAEFAEPGATRHCVFIELGMDARQTNITLGPGQTLHLPDILFYPFSNKEDLDCYKLHAWLNRNLPRKKLPIIYNTWLYCFDSMTADGLLAQIPRARELGCDYFVLDASWYGPKASWKTTRGDWKEYPDGALEGRMAEVSAAVRKAGMGFGFWLEPETANDDAQILKDHPEYFYHRKNKHFLDFSKPEALSYITETTCGLIEKYHASFMKFDFNQDTDYDASGTAFTAFHKGFATYLQRLRERYPDLYLEGCASGGMRMALAELRLFDSFWLSDNQSPYHGIRIVKDTMLRFMPQAIERWVVAKSAENFLPAFRHGNRPSPLFAADDGAWRELRSVTHSMYEGFLTGGVLGYSCDLNALSEEDLALFRKASAAWKQDCAFWQTAVGRILCDTEQLLGLQYSDEDLSEVRVLMLPQYILNKTATLIPVLDPAARYALHAEGHPQSGEIRSGSEWMELGLSVEKVKRYELYPFTLKKV